MKQWKVKLLCLGYAYAPKSVLTPNLDPDLWLEFPQWSFLLQGDDRNILVDSGVNERFLVDGKGW